MLSTKLKIIRCSTYAAVKFTSKTNAGALRTERQVLPSSRDGDWQAESDWMEFLVLARQLLCGCAGTWAHFERMGGWNDGPTFIRGWGAGRMTLRGMESRVGVSIAHGSGRARRWLVSVHPERTH